MKGNGREYSLLPYVNPLHGSIHLRLSLAAHDTTILKKTPFPFLVINESNLIVRPPIEAQFLTDAGGEDKKDSF